MVFGKMGTGVYFKQFFHHGTAGGATIAGLSVAQFFVVLVIREVRGAVVDRSLAAVNDRSDPMRDGWFTDETQDAVQAVLASLRK